MDENSLELNGELTEQVNGLNKRSINHQLNHLLNDELKNQFETHSNESMDSKEDLSNDLKTDLKNDLKNDLNNDLKNDLKTDLKLEDRTNEDKLSEVILNNENRSTDELLKEEMNFRNQQEIKHDDEESSKYESLDNSLSNQELTKETNSNDSQIKESEFVELFGNPDLLKRIIKKGDENALKPERSYKVLINLEMRNQLTNELIESESEQNLSVFVGDFDIIHGVDLALLTMHKNEIAEILIKPLVGYGPLGKLPDIPSNCVLLCKVELLEIISPNDMICGNLDALNHYFKLSIRKKERGNFFFKRGEFETALLCYARSGALIDFIGHEMVNRHHMLTDSENKATNESKKEISDELIAINELSVEYMKIKLDVFNNLSAVNIKIKSYNNALDAVENALLINPNDKKALYRKSVILSHKGHIEEAIDSLKQVLRLEPNNRTFLNEFKKLKEKLKKEIKQEKELYSKMLQTKKRSESTNKRTNTDQRLNYLATGLIVSGVLLGSFILYRKFVNSN